MTNLTLTITTEQASAMIRLLDLATRIHMCQFGEIAYLARFGYIKDCDGKPITAMQCKALEETLNEAKAICGYCAISSSSISSSHVDKDAHRGYEIKKVIEKALAEHRNPNPPFRGVNYDGLINRITTDPAPIAIITGSETNKEPA